MSTSKVVEYCLIKLSAGFEVLFREFCFLLRCSLPCFRGSGETLLRVSGNLLPFKVFAPVLPLLGKCYSGYQGICFLIKVFASVLPLRVCREMLLNISGNLLPQQDICFCASTRGIWENVCINCCLEYALPLQGICFCGKKLSLNYCSGYLLPCQQQIKNIS